MTSLPPAKTVEKINLCCVLKKTSFVYVCFAKMSEGLVFDSEKNDYTEL